MKENLHKVEAYITTSLEKWRWENRSYGKSYVIVNIASYELYMYDQRNIVFSSKIVVGKPENQTPELQSELNSILVFPKWHVPYSIASKEILPLIQNNSTYLSSQNMEILDRDENIVDPDEINWEEYNEHNLPFMFRQREGEGNALGVLKFYFPNKYGVYMHDTNEKNFFKRSVRAFSHGCIRVEKPREFAGYLLGRSDSVPQRIDSLLSNRISRSLSVKDPVALYIRYFEAEVVNDTLYLHPDIYKKDTDLLRYYSL